MVAARTAGLDFVPAVAAKASGETWTDHGGRLWDLTSWLPGRADFQERPSPARLAAACTALARLHLVWSGTTRMTGPCPAVLRRLRLFQEWQDLLASGWKPLRSNVSAAAAGPWLERAWHAVQPHLDAIPRLLSPWLDCSVFLQPCLCDIWHDHLLFEGDRVAGLVDYGGVKMDHPAVDLARLLGSLARHDAGLRDAGLRAYRSWRPLADEEESLVAVLDETGAILAAVNWLLWLCRDGRQFEDESAVARRLAAVVELIEAISALPAAAASRLTCSHTSSGSPTAALRRSARSRLPGLARPGRRLA